MTRKLSRRELLKGLLAGAGVTALAACTGAPTPTAEPTKPAAASPTIVPTSVPNPAEAPKPTAAAPTIAPTIAPKPTDTPKLATVADSGVWVTGDFHTHTWLTDGVTVQSDVIENAFGKYGLNWFMNSEHGGTFGHEPNGKWWEEIAKTKTVKFLGDKTTAKDEKGIDHQAMWRWQSLQEFSYPILFGGKDGFGDEQPGLQVKYPKQTIIQGFEWNVPSHEHASVGILGLKDAKELAAFEYQFDQSDKDKSRAGEGLIKTNAAHSDAVAGVNYLQQKFPKSSYFMINHPSRKMAHTAADIRDLITFGPDVCLGLEGFPGHQKDPARGGYGSEYFKDADKKVRDEEKIARARTYGGADLMLAKVGGLMDSLWGEGRKFWVFVNSDFHSAADDADFWPGEYAKTYVKAKDNAAQNVVDGMRSGNVFIVHGDLIDGLDFQAASGSKAATMGQEVATAKGADVTVTIRFKSPAKNNSGDAPKVDHIDLIAGEVTGLAKFGSDGYKSETNPTTKVIATFTSKDWKTDTDGFQRVTITLPKIEKAQYIRLRGTNLGLGVPNETDKDGNPLIDDLVGKSNKAKAFADLWFYSNPIFVTIG